MEMGWAGNPWAGTQRWITAERLWDTFSATLPPERKIEVTHEELIIEPVATLTKLSEFIGAPYDPAMMSYPEDTTYGPPTKSLIQQWKKKMSERDVQLVEARVRDMMVARGYELSGFPPLEVTPEMEAQLRRENVQGKRKFRQKRYGMWLWTLDAVARRLHIGPLERKLKRRIDDIDTTYLK
jgi:hypothetical protein